MKKVGGAGGRTGKAKKEERRGAGGGWRWGGSKAGGKF